MHASMRKKEIASKQASAVLKTIIDEVNFIALVAERSIASQLCHTVFRCLTVGVSIYFTQREFERRGSSGGGYMELSATQALAAKKAAEARAQYKQQLATNQARIQSSLANRKSLMELHDTVSGAISARICLC